MYNFIKYVTEGRKERLEQVELPYARDKLGRSLSKQAIDLHYGKLYRAYVDRYNKGEGDDEDDGGREDEQAGKEGGLAQCWWQRLRARRDGAR